MPSYRVIMTIGRVHPGANVQALLPTAAAAVSALTTVEAKSVAVVRGRGTATVRFEAADDAAARPIATAATEAAWTCAEVVEAQLRRSAGTRWLLIVAPAGTPEPGR